jgi:hypothetical protein
MNPIRSPIQTRSTLATKVEDTADTKTERTTDADEVKEQQDTEKEERQAAEEDESMEEDKQEFQHDFEALYYDALSEKEDMKQVNKSLQQAITALTAVMQNAASPRSPSNAPIARIKLNPPAPFTGKNRREALEFMSRCELNLDTSASLFSNNHKIQYVVSFLVEDARQWYYSMVQKQDKVFDSFVEFKTFFLERFGENEALTEQIAENALQLLRQKYSVHSYSTEFCRLIVYTRHAPYTQMTMFKNGLKRPIKLYLLALPIQPKTLSELIQVAVSYDEQVQVLERQEHRVQAPDLTRGRSQDSKTISVNEASVKKIKRSQSTSLSHEERRRRRDLNLCHYCGGDKCPGAMETAKCELLLSKNAKAPLGNARQQQ